jgi:hypothetical protein
MYYSNNYRDENELINIIIGLTFPRSNFPHPFFKLGYELKAIEQSFINYKGNTVKPDLIIANKKNGYIIIFEAKSGKNAGKKQLENYSNIKKDDLINNAGFERDFVQNGFDVSYVCYQYTYIDEEKTAAYNHLIKGIEESYQIPLLKYDKDNGYLSLELNKFKDEKINKLTVNIIQIPQDKIPQVINFDQHSSIKELIPVAVQNIISYILEEKLEFTLEELTNDLLSPYPGLANLIGSETKKAVKNKVRSVMSKLKDKKPDYFKWRNDQKIWEIDESLSDPNYNQLNALRNLISYKDQDVDNQMSIFDK